MTKKGPVSKSDGKQSGMGNKFEKTAALYVRYSHAERTDENRGDENMSLAAQKDQTERFAQSLGLNVVKIYSEPLGTSVSRFSDKETKVFKKALADMGEVYHTLVMDEGTRFSRLKPMTIDTVTTLNTISEAGGRMISRDGKCDTDTLDTIGGRLNFIIGMEFAAEESEKISYRSKRGKEEAARRNLWDGGQAPYGLKVVRYQDRPTDLERVDEECEVAVRIFDMIIAGASTSNVAKILNDEGIRTKKGKLFHSSLICRMVRNKLWIGLRTNHDDVARDEDGEPFMCQWGQIIDPAKFYAVDEILKKRNRRRAAGDFARKRCHLLAGMVNCGCGGTTTTRHVKAKTTASTLGYRNDARYQRCSVCKPVHSVNGFILEEVIVTQALSHLAQQDPNSNMVTEVARQWIHKHSVGNIRVQNALQSEAVKIQARINELTEWYFVDQKISKDQFDELTTTLQGKLTAIEAELVTSGAVEGLDVSPLFDLLQSSDGESLTGEGSAWSQLPIYEQRVILSCIIDNVVVSKMEGCGIHDKIAERTSITFNADEDCIEQAIRADRYPTRVEVTA